MSEKTATTGRSKTAVAIDRILEMIDGSALKPGDRLPSERALAAELRVSRATVREAIMALQIAGRLESRSGDGTYILVRPINIGDDETKLRAGVDITEALEYRMAIEISASIMACRRARKSDIMRMQAVLEAMAEFVAEEDYESYLDSSMDLHLAIGKASHSKQLRSVHDALTEQVRDDEWLLAESYNEDVALRSMEIHRDIVNAIAAKDIDRVVCAVETHYVDYPTLGELDES